MRIINVRQCGMESFLQNENFQIYSIVSTAQPHLMHNSCRLYIVSYVFHSQRKGIIWKSEFISLAAQIALLPDKLIIVAKRLHNFIHSGHHLVTSSMLLI